MRVIALCSLTQFVDDMAWCWLIRIAHTEVNNVFATTTGLGLQVVNNIEYVRWQPFNARKFFHGIVGFMPILIRPDVELSSAAPNWLFGAL